MTDQPTTPSVPADFDASLRVEQYIKLRDMKDAIKERHKEELELVNKCMDELEVMLQSHMQQTNAQSIKTNAGTVYQTSKQSASIADKDAFWTHIVTQAAWDLLDRRANVTAVEDYINKNGTPPPGVNYNRIVTVGVRRA